MTTPRPDCDGTTGSFSLSSYFRDLARIHDGILSNEVKDWKDPQMTVDGFFENCKDASGYKYEDFIKLHHKAITNVMSIVEDDITDSDNKRFTQFIKGFASKLDVHLSDPAVNENLELAFKDKVRETNPNLPEIPKSKDPILTTANVNEDSDVREFSNLCFELPEDMHRYKVDQFDVSKHFYEFQESLKNRKEKLFVESHVHHILALSYVLLLKPGRMHDDLVEVFGAQNLNLLMEDLNKMLGLNQSYLPMKIIMDITKLIEDVRKKVITTNQAIIDLLNMEKDIDKNSFKVVKSIANILDKIPNVAIMDPIMETELSTRYIEPLLCGLFDDPQRGIFFRCIDERPQEIKNSKRYYSSAVPDAVISVLEGVKWKDILGICEVKCMDQSENNNVLSKDLIRLGLLSKRNIDDNSMNGTVSIQVVGSSIIFYLTIHTHDHLYIMYEIAEVKAPRCLDDLLTYLMDFNKLLSVVNICEKWCNSQAPTDNDVSRSNVKSAGVGEGISSFVSPSIKISRPCITKHDYR